MFSVKVWYKNETYDSFDSVTSVEIADGPFHRELTENEIKNLEFGSSKDIYVFNDKSHIIAKDTFKRITISDS